jgi:CRP-like cAMP-binding protein
MRPMAGGGIKMEGARSASGTNGATHEVLRRVGLFATLPDDDLATLGASLRRRRYPRGAVIFVEGEPGSTLYLIESGMVRISVASPAGRELVIALLGPGEFFGDLALLDGEAHSADAVARHDCRLLLLRRDDFLGFVRQRPNVAAELLAVLSRRLRRNTQMLQEAAFLDIPGRLASELLRLAESQGRPAAGGLVISASLTQSELASIVRATRESINKWLRYFERRGWLHWSKGTITILDAERLRALTS